jgi:hypothetical protein
MCGPAAAAAPGLVGAAKGSAPAIGKWLTLTAPGGAVAGVAAYTLGLGLANVGIHGNSALEG